MIVCKRDGVTKEQFDINKIVEAVRKAGAPDPSTIAEAVSACIEHYVEIGVETIQDTVEIALMREKLFDVAKAYILYRENRKNLRLTQRKPDPTAISNYIHASKYARYIPELGRREVYAETVNRVKDMHLARFPVLAEEIEAAFELVHQKKLLPSMRSMQFAGPAILETPNRIYNCSASLVDRLEVFSEAFYLLLCGCGVGYSVQFEHVEQLPVIGVVDTASVRHHVVQDTIEGWADALKALIQGFQDGVNVEFSYHLIRPAGAPLKTSGGRAPGHLKLKSSLEQIRLVLKGSEGRRLSTIECHRIMCHAADAVLSGGIRRSAMISLFSPTDHEMINAKTGNWYEHDPWFANSNNSVVLDRQTATIEDFDRTFAMIRQWGEPGFFFSDNSDYATNPCAEILLNPVLEKNGQSVTGFAFCNLCEINASKFTSYSDFEVAAKAATLIGTLQASYTSMPYLGSVSEDIAKRDALLGVGITGMLDAARISCDPDYQKILALEIKRWNSEYAEIIGINPAIRLTCVKPSGSTSLALGGVGSGHHPHHAKRYIRRVTADALEHVFQAFRKVNPHMCVRKPDGKWVIEFPVEAPEGATTRSDLSAIQFLEMIKSTQQNWVVPGTRTPGLNHSVSNTVTVRPDEWEEVREFIWNNREFFTGVSLLASSGDKDYSFAPNEEIQTEADERRWNQILDNYKPVDYTSIMETEDSTNLSSEPACAGGVCEIT